MNMAKARKHTEEEIAKARTLYITTNKPLAEIGRICGINKQTLTNYCQQEKWTVFKQIQPDTYQVSKEVYGAICDSVEFYNNAKKEFRRLFDEIASAPETMPDYDGTNIVEPISKREKIKALKELTEAYNVAEVRMMELMIIGDKQDK